MIELYYTGASEPFVAQQDIRQSLGGHISSSKIPNSEHRNEAPISAVSSSREY